MGTTAEKIRYAINATNDIAEGINNIGGNITQNTELADFREELDNLYNEMPKVTQSGTSISLANTRKGKLLLTPKGNIEQDAEPTPENPQDIKVVTGENAVKISGSNLVNENNLTGITNIDNITNKIVTSNPLTNTGSAGCNVGFPEFNIETGNYYISADIRLKSGTVNSLRSIQIWTRSSWTVSASWVNNPSLSNEFQRYVNKYTVNNIGDISNTIYSFYTQLSNPDNAVLEIKNIQISRTNVNYEPYIEPIEKELNLGNIELAKIGDYSDIIFKNEKSSQYYDNTLTENAWYKKQIIKSKVYDENNNFQLGSASTNDYYIFQTDYGDDIRDSKQTGNIIICDNFEFSNTEGDYQREYVAINPNAYSYVRFHIASSRLSEKSVNAFKNWLETHNVLIYYILENPIYTQITDTTLISQLEELNSIIGQGGTVVVETESENENAQLIVNASALASFENS